MRATLLLLLLTACFNPFNDKDNRCFVKHTEYKTNEIEQLIHQKEVLTAQLNRTKTGAELLHLLKDISDTKQECVERVSWYAYCAEDPEPGEVYRADLMTFEVCK